MGTSSKLRVVFDRKILNKHQRLEGLTRSWVLLKPNIKTISDFQSYVQKRFRLDKKCPNGVVLYIDGFVLPPFESTCMLHESDIVSVRKKDNTQINSTEVGDKQLVTTEAGENSNGQKQKTGKALCMHNENGIRTDSQFDSKKKRKHSDEDPRPNVRKKDNTQINSTEVGDKPLVTTEAGENSNGQKQKAGKALCMHNENGIRTDSQLDSKKKRKHSDEDPRPKKKKLKANSKEQITQEEDEDIIDKVVDCQIRKKSSNCSSDDHKLACSLRRVKQYKPIVNDVAGGSAHNHANENVAKKQSRNARRKKEKKILIRELKNQNSQNDNQQFGINNKLIKRQETKQNTEIVKETAPPAPSDQQWQTEEKQATDNWNRLASRKKQNNESVNQWNQSTAPSNHKYCNINQKSRSKWSDHTNNGNQNYARNSSNRRNNADGHNEQKWDWRTKNYKEPCNGTTSKWNNVVNNKELYSGNTNKWDDANYEQATRKEIVPLNEMKGSSPIDFESLFPLTRIPRAGDVIAYRLIEMSPTWCPSVTPFRIGEVTSYNYLTLSVVLVPVPEYPIFIGDTQQKSSPYKEDGTLQIHYPSLIDVRLFTAFDSFKIPSDSFGSLEREKNPQKENSATVDKWELALTNGGSNFNEIATQPIENGNGSGGSTWDRIKRMINERRSEIDESKKDGWGEWALNKSSPSKSSWQSGCSEWNSSRRYPQQATRGRGSFRGGRGRGNYSKPSFGKRSA